MADGSNTVEKLPETKASFSAKCDSTPPQPGHASAFSVSVHPASLTVSLQLVLRFLLLLPVGVHLVQKGVVLVQEHLCLLLTVGQLTT